MIFKVTKLFDLKLQESIPIIPPLELYKLGERTEGMCNLCFPLSQMPCMSVLGRQMLLCMSGALVFTVVYVFVLVFVFVFVFALVFAFVWTFLLVFVLAFVMVFMLLCMCSVCEPLCGRFSVSVIAFFYIRSVFWGVSVGFPVSFYAGGGDVWCWKWFCSL